MIEMPSLPPSPSPGVFGLISVPQWEMFYFSLPTNLGLLEAFPLSGMGFFIFFFFSSRKVSSYSILLFWNVAGFILFEVLHPHFLSG